MPLLSPLLPNFTGAAGAHVAEAAILSAAAAVPGLDAKPWYSAAIRKHVARLKAYVFCTRHHFEPFSLQSSTQCYCCGGFGSSRQQLDGAGLLLLYNDCCTLDSTQ